MAEELCCMLRICVCAAADATQARSSMAYSSGALVRMGWMVARCHWWCQAPLHDDHPRPQFPTVGGVPIGNYGLGRSSCKGAWQPQWHHVTIEPILTNAPELCAMAMT